MRFKDFYEDAEEHEADELILILKNRPSDETDRLILECNLALLEGEQVLEEGGPTKQWNSALSYRLDHRPANQGGDQLHVNGRRGEKWAYRQQGRSRSEPSKYRLRTTRPVRELVADVFDIPAHQVAEAKEIRVENGALVIEVTFA